MIGFELHDRLVYATVATALKFLAARSPLDSTSLLAQGGIRTMTPSKRLTMFGLLILTAGLIGSVGWVTARSDTGDRPGRSSAARTELMDEAQTVKKEGKKQDGGNEAKAGTDQKQQVIEKLSALAAELRGRLDTNIVHIQEVKYRALIQTDPQDEIEFQTLQSLYKLEHDLLVEELREKIDQVAKARHQMESELRHLSDLMAPNSDKGKEILANRTATLNKGVEDKVKELELTKQSMKKLNERYLPEITKYKARLTTRTPDVGALEVNCAELREQLSIVNRHLFMAKLRQLGEQEAQAGQGVEQKLEQLSREVQELRKEVEDLKKRK